MSTVFALIKVQIPVIDPQTRKIVGENAKDITKGFQGENKLEDLRAWVLANQATTCSLMFETPQAKANPGQKEPVGEPPKVDTPEGS
jgi:hypothetical protein